MMVMIIVVIYSGNDDCNKTMKMVVSDGVWWCLIDNDTGG